ncbi:L,D-transpeptidase [Phyllobacterium myrsinacearum]|uniref:L,D-transpeptidase n=1 Tax=Phyllobacterium myrsinacearum TaxID=28101 RepID=A0A2S9JP25_9HYPH|nr:L,D-transpeptidase [Phyllobacterium myrsinacearum]PWV90453.1 L,D-transpeptidase-like protein [Phyllobacterium myrsinacearum]RZV05353.1 L,D-transpeptidase-like protein [Phyllobacterium myrsinacearum]
MRMKHCIHLVAIALMELCLGAVNTRAQVQEPSPPIFDTKTHKVWIQPGYIDFLMGAEASPLHRENGQYKPGQSAIPPKMVAYATSEKPGTIVIDTANHALYLVGSNGKALRYSVGVGRERYGWSGTERISRKRQWPDWRPPAAMRDRRPDLPAHMVGGPANPLGARALYLGHTLFRIHGSNEPETVGQDSSSGCFRMTNRDIIDLYQRVRVGTKVVVR